MIKLPVVFRELRSTDTNFLFDSWLKSYRNNWAVTPMPPNLYFKEQRWVIVKMLAASNVIVAANQEDPDQTLGFIAFEPTKIKDTAVIHYLYVKTTYRGLGVGKELLDLACKESHSSDELPIVVSHCSAEFTRFCDKYFVYNPFIKGDYR